MRKIFLPLFVLLFATVARAQYVNIPDSNFRNFLISKYPACFNASKQMDTTCGDVVNEDSLAYNAFGKNIKSIKGLKYFKSLTYLLFSQSDIDSLTELPNSIQTLLVYHNKIKALPQLPLSLYYLNCSNNLLNTLPYLPTTLTDLHCSGNLITTLQNLPSSLINLNCDGNKITSLPTLPNNLKSLSCNSCSIITLPTLPSSLEYLSCKINFITTLPTLPANLLYLDCSKNSIASLPTLPNNVKKLYCDNTQIVSITALPDSLLELTCHSDVITFTFGELISLPTLPSKLQLLTCSGNPHLKNLPPLPASLKYLDCSNDSLVSLPILPNTLDRLLCNNNFIKILPNLPTSLVRLDCSSNRITTIPKLPKYLLNLECGSNYLTSLPDLPNYITRISCGANNIYCLPRIPKSVTELYFDNNKIKCLPNPVANLNYPVCNSINNVNGCPKTNFPSIIGTVFYDANSNNVKDSLEFLAENIRLNFSNSTTLFTNKDGKYYISSDTIGMFTTTPSPIQYIAFNPAYIANNFITYDTIINQSIAIQPNIIKDSISLYSFPTVGRLRPGSSFASIIKLKNCGTTNFNNLQLAITIDTTKIILDSIKNIAYTNLGGKAIANIASLPFGGHLELYCYYRVKTTVTLGDLICFNDSVFNNNVNAISKFCSLASASFDPNDKQATPELSTTQVAEGKRIDYTIRFQNTGNDTAFHVVIADTLDSKLNFNSLQMIATSHLCKTTIKDNIIFFEMRNIMLPDSNIDKLGSNGFIRFTMQPKNTVVAGNNIPNKAAIYFDYNSPVITNTAITQIKNPILPVRFTMFDVRCTMCSGYTPSPLERVGVRLDWTTANEVNVSHFVVQRSEDGRVYKSVGKVAAKGNGSYSFTDPLTTNNLPSTIFYRIQSIDNDGKTMYSEVKEIRLNELTNKQISVYPNPAKNELNFKFHNSSLINTTASIVSVGGTVFKQFIVSSTTQKIDVSSLPNGTYYLQTIDGSKKFVVER